MGKLDEEVGELRAELPGPGLEDSDTERLADELGDVLFVVANLARKLGLDPETCLQHATLKFTRRFNAVEQRLAEAGGTPADATLEAMEAHWIAVKRSE